MVGNWIKMGVGLRTHPKVVRIASALKADRLRVIGGLHAVWSVFDEHSTDGFLEGYGHDAIDGELGWKGFAAAMQAVGWLEVEPDGAHLPDYSEHNGPTAKRRAMETSRKGKARKKSAHKKDGNPDEGGNNVQQETGQMSAHDADEVRNRGRVREEVLDTPPQEGRGVTRKARASALPPDFGISPEIRAWAEREGFTQFLDAHLAYFLDYAAAKHPVYVDWDAAFRNAIRSDWGDVRKTAMRTPANGQAAIDEFLRRTDATH